jgi:hypothetical protein
MLLKEDARARLRYVRAEPGRVDLSRFPDFLIIGPQRTGTTWLHANLREHPEIFLAEPKEIFFFSRIKTPEHPKFQSDALAWYLARFRYPPWLLGYKHAMCLSRYGERFRPKIRGEATASYAAIDRDVIEEIAALNPEIKAIMMVRHPVERAWSHAKKDLARNLGRSLESVTDEQFHAFFRDPYQIRCARYTECLDNWRSVLAPNHVLVGRFEEVATEPIDFLTRVLRFLGVSSEARYIPTSAKETINPTEGAAVPERHRRFLEDLLAEEVASWQRTFCGKA